MIASAKTVDSPLALQCAVDCQPDSSSNRNYGLVNNLYGSENGLISEQKEERKQKKYYQDCDVALRKAESYGVDLRVVCGGSIDCRCGKS